MGARLALPPSTCVAPEGEMSEVANTTGAARRAASNRALRRQPASWGGRRRCRRRSGEHRPRAGFRARARPAWRENGKRGSAPRLSLSMPTTTTSEGGAACRAARSAASTESRSSQLSQASGVDGQSRGRRKQSDSEQAQDPSPRCAPQHSRQSVLMRTSLRRHRPNLGLRSRRSLIGWGQSGWGHSTPWVSGPGGTPDQDARRR